MKVCEIFTSIQGESTYAGLPCTFVRLTGCNLRCLYCDTRYAYDEGVEMTVEDIIRRVGRAGLRLVEITGGEPLLQGETPLLVKGLLDSGYDVLIETNGSLSIKDVDERATIILDVKTPGSGESGRIDSNNFRYLKPSDEIKFVLCGRDDYDWAKEFISDRNLWDKHAILFSPVAPMLEPSALAQWMTEDRLRARLNIQIHKYVFGPDARGV
jgi:7-carboxy-7-deazaguanine synthase